MGEGGLVHCDGACSGGRYHAGGVEEGGGDAGRGCLPSCAKHKKIKNLLCKALETLVKALKNGNKSDVNESLESNADVRTSTGKFSVILHKAQKLQINIAFSELGPSSRGSRMVHEHPRDVMFGIIRYH